MRSRVPFTTAAVLFGLGLSLAARAQEPSGAQGPAGAQESSGQKQARPEAAPAPGEAAESPSPPAADVVQALRQEIQELRNQIRLLQDQVAALTAAAPPATPPAGAAAQPAEVPASPPGPETGAQQAPPPLAPARSQSLMNPAISAVFQMIGATSTRENDETNGFDLSEAEIALQSVIDPYARMDLFLSFPSSESPEVEEGYATTLSLPGSLQLKGGRFKSAFGKWNTLHNHAFFTVERPDALTNFFGEESLTNDGLSLSLLVPNPWHQYIESATQVGTPRPGESFNSARRNLSYLEHLSWFMTPSANGNLEFGLTAAWGRTGPSEALLNDIAACGVACSSLQTRDELDSAVQGIDVTYKWKPLHLNVYKSFLWQTEFLHSQRDVDVLDSSTPALVPGSVSSLGGYTYLEWQLRKRWRIGGRYDLSGFPDDRTARIWAGSAVVRFQPSEFQEIRFQFKRTMRNDEATARFDDEESDNQMFFEWIPVIGAHGAHKF